VGKIIVIDDDVDVTESVSRWLRFEQHVVDVANTAAEGAYYLKMTTYDLIILDWNLEEAVSGVDLCKEYRSRGGESLILMLTGRTSTQEVEEGLDAGADDYLKKPFLMDELSAKVRALMRRATGQRTEKTITGGDLTLKLASHELLRGGEAIDLSPLEFELLKFFMLNPDKVFSLEMIQARVWNQRDSSQAAVRKYLASLREKLCPQDSSAYIQTLHGVGYRFSPAAK